MKRLIIALLLLIPAWASAQETRSQATASLMGLGMPAALAEKVAGLSTGLAVMSSSLNFASGGTIAIQEATAGSACSGTLTANGATPVVTSTTCASTGARIFLTRTSAETGTIDAYVSAISNGVSFSITSEAADTGTYNWVIFKEAP